MVGGGSGVGVGDGDGVAVGDGVGVGAGEGSCCASVLANINGRMSASDCNKRNSSESSGPEVRDQISAVNITWLDQALNLRHSLIVSEHGKNDPRNRRSVTKISYGSCCLVDRFSSLH